MSCGMVPTQGCQQILKAQQNPVHRYSACILSRSTVRVVQMTVNIFSKWSSPVALRISIASASEIIIPLLEITSSTRIRSLLEILINSLYEYDYKIFIWSNNFLQH